MTAFADGWASTMLGVALGATISALGRQGGSRKQAAEQLADLPRLVWSKGGPEDWLNLQVGLGRLQVSLRSAGVPENLQHWVDTAARELWQELKWMPDIETWVDFDEFHVHLGAATAAVLDRLQPAWRMGDRRRAQRLYRSQGAPFLNRNRPAEEWSGED